MQRLSGADASFVYGETARLRTCTRAQWPWSIPRPPLVVLTWIGCAPWSRLGKAYSARSCAVLIEVPLGLDRPAWVDDPALRSKSPDPPCRRPGPGWPSRTRCVGRRSAGLQARAGTTPVGGVGSSRASKMGTWLCSRRCITAWRTECGAPTSTRCSTISNLAPLSISPIHPHFRASEFPPGWEMALRALPRLASTPLRAARTSGYLCPDPP